MQVYSLSYPVDWSAVPLSGSQTMAIGDFDGFHLGHRQVIGHAVEEAQRLRIPAAVMTFHPHPREVLGNDRYRELLTPLSDKLELFERMGVDRVFVMEFDSPFSQLTPDCFVQDVLSRMQAERLVVGFDFRFGHGGQGTAERLKTLCEGQCAIEIVPPFQLDGAKVSSTTVRECLESGDLAQANRLLGRTYGLRGVVVKGDQRGRTIGFPTANLDPVHRYVIPANGVYAVQVTIGEETVVGVMNIGTRPTFKEGPERSLEAHLLDFDRDIYGEEAYVRFVAYIRAERRFASVDQLVDQIREDVEQARKLLRDTNGSVPV